VLKLSNSNFSRISGVIEMKPQISLLVTDLDNTLYDWVEMWYKAFESMLGQLVEISGVSRETLEPEIQKIYQRHRTTEYAFLIEEIPSLRKKHPKEDLTIVYKDAINAYRHARNQTLRLYPGVFNALEKIKGKGCKIVVFTESMGFYTLRRLKKLGLDGILDFVYSPPDHSRPKGTERYYEEKAYEFEKTIHRFTPKGEHKPNADILLSIISAEGINSVPQQTIYVGDSLMKDVKMAQDADIIDVYAKYGVATNSDAYIALRRVTHWTKEDVEREKKISAEGIVTPNYVLAKSFEELFNFFEFVSYEKNT
jgi:FMN phosphatase YigB (HAD superfamily)